MNYDYMMRGADVTGFAAPVANVQNSLCNIGVSITC